MKDQNFYRSIYENLEIPIFLVGVDAQGEVTYAGCNPAHERAMHLRQTDLKGKRFDELPASLGATAPTLRAHCQRCMETGAGLEYEERLVIHGYESWWLIRLTPVHNEEGSIFQLIGARIDITESKTQRQKTEQTEARIRRLTRLYATLSQVNQTIVRVKEAAVLFERICAISVEYGQFPLAWIGLWDETAARLDPTVYAGDEQGYQMFAGGNAGRKFVATIEAAINSRKVTTLHNPADAHTAVQYTSFAAIPFEKRGKIKGVLNVYTTEADFFSQEELSLLEEIRIDVSYALEAMEIERERKQAEMALARQEMELRNLLESSPGLMGTFYLRPDGTACMPYVSPSIWDLFGLRPEDVAEDVSPLLARTHPEDIDKVNESIAESARTMTPWHLEYRVIHPARGELWLEGSTNPKPHPDGGVIWYGFVHDITPRKRAEEEFRASEARFRTLVDHAADAFFLHDEQGFVLDVNRQACESLGYTREELIGMFPAVFDADLEMALIEQIPARLAAGEMIVFDTHHRRKDGTVFPVEVRARSFEQAGRKLSISLARDISKRKRAEMDLQRTNDLLRAIIEAAPVAIIGLDLDGHVQTVWNPAAEKMLGWQAQEVMGRPLPTVPAEKQEEFRQFRAQIRKGLILDGVEVRRQKRDGTPIDYSIYASPLYDAENQISGNIAVLVDITERKRADELLHRREQEFRALAENSPDFIGRYDREARIVYANPAVEALLGQPLEQMAGKTLVELNPGVEAAQQYYAEIREAVKTGMSIETEITIQTSPGAAPLYHNIRFVPEFDREGQVVSVLFVGRDITANKQAERERLAHLRFFESMDKVNRAIQSARDLEQMMMDVMDVLLVIFACDRAFLVYPCDPEAATWQVQMERTRPKFPGGPQGVEMPLDPVGAEVFRILRNSDQPVAFGPGSEYPVPEVMTQFFSIQSFLAMAFYPKVGKPWSFGLHQCTHPRLWSLEERRLFLEIGRRMADALTSLLTFRDLRAKTQELETLFSLSSHLRTAQTEEDILRLAGEAMKRELQADASAINLLDQDKKQFIVALADGFLAQNTGQVFDADQGISGLVYETRQPYFLEDYLSHPHSLKNLSAVEAFGPAVFVPLQSEGQFIGVVIAIRKKGPGVQPFTEAAARLLTTIGEMLGNSLQRMRLYHQALTRLRHLQALQTIDTTILSSMDQNLTLGIILNEVIRNTGVDAAAILLFDPVSFTLVYAAGQGFRTTFIQDTHLQLGKGHAGQVALERKVLHIDNLLEIQEPFDEQLVSKEGFVAYYAVPMITKGKVSGVLEVYHRSVLEMGSEMKNFLSALANQAAIAMDNAQLFNELQHTNLELVMAYDQTIEGWSRALDLRDKETEGHTQRVTDLTMRLARALGISGEPLIHIRRGALLHDIGKMGIPDHILLKPGELTEIEWEIMKKHPTYAYELLHPIYYLRPALDIPYCHHENWDGNGYPRGLKGEQIPLAARMFALADVWDALRSDRPYRPGWPEEKVREHIRALSGSYFDPEIARIFLRLVE